jgi:ribosomal protein S18 acetylase RimI-like enzyme
MPDPTVNVRPATHADFAAVAALLSDFAAQHNRWEPSLFRPTVLGFTDAIFQTWLKEPDALHLVAETGGEVVGYASAFRGAGHVSDFTSPRRNVYVGIIGVAADRHRTGIGRALFRSIEAWAQEYRAEHIGLNVNAQNERTKAFYAALGYHTTSEYRSKTLRQIKRMNWS